MASEDKNRCAKCSMVVLEVFPMIMQDLMAHTGTQAKTLYNAIMQNAPFIKNLNKSERDMVDTLQRDEYTKIDVSLSYRIIVNFFQLFIPPPSRQWGANPNDTEIGIGEDIERIRWERNRFVHRVDANIPEPMFESFFVTFIEVGKRIDAYLNKPPNNGYAHTIEQYKTFVLDPETEKKLLDARADIEQLKVKYGLQIGRPAKKIIHVFVGKSTEAAIEKIKAEEDLKESYTKLKIIVHEVDDSEEMVKLINSFKDDFNNENIIFKGAEEGSIILFIDVKNRVLIDDDLFQKEVITIIRKLFELCSLTCNSQTQTSAVIASASEEFEEPINNLPGKATGRCLMGHVVVNFDVKYKIFNSPDSLNKALNGIFETLVIKGNEHNLLGKTDVYAELVKSDTTEAFLGAQNPVFNNLPVSVTLRKQINIKKLRIHEYLFVASCIKTGNTLVSVDWMNKRLNIFKADGTDIRQIILSYEPCYITDIDSNTVAVSCKVNTILIMNISTGAITSTIKTSKYCNGLSYDGSNLYILIGEGKTIPHVMDLSGKIIRTIPVPLDHCHDITVDKDRLVCIDMSSIYCCSLDGNIIWKRKMDEFQDLVRLTTDNEGNVYVSIAVTNSVVVVSDNGQHYKQILTKSDGLNWPEGIYFDKKENILLVCNHRDGNNFLFDVKKKIK